MSRKSADYHQVRSVETISEFDELSDEVSPLRFPVTLQEPTK